MRQSWYLHSDDEITDSICQFMNVSSCHTDDASISI